ncbi:MAG: DUF3014 domain-containing protein [Gemmatimonadota bacterium]
MNPRPNQPMNRRRRTSPTPPLPIVLGGAALLVLVVVGGYLWLSTRPDPGEVTPADPQPAKSDSTLGEFEAPWTWGTGPGVDPEPLVLPEVAESDAFLRDLLRGLSNHPRVATWLVPDELVHRFVRAVVAVSAGASPLEPLDFMIPEDSFAVATAMDRTVISPDAYSRYDTPLAALRSVDPQAAARLYAQLLPLLSEAHRELGFPEGTFDQTFSTALEEILRVSVPAGAVPVVPSEVGVGYAFGDSRLEALSPAAKHLMRLGPRNARALQEWVSELGQAIWGSAPR